MDFLETLENGSLAQIEQAIGERLAKNSSFFKRSNPKMYTLLTKSTKYYQLYVGKEGINIYNMSSKNFVYPIKDGKHTLIDISKQYADNPPGNPLWRFYNNNNSISKMDEERFPQTSIIQNKIVDSALQKESLHVGIAHLPPKTLPVTDILGLGAGLFLEYLLREFDHIHTLLIYEESYDFFRISCCFVDYEELFCRMENGSLYLFVEDIVDKKIVKTFFSRRRISSNYIRLELSMYETPKIAEIRRTIELEQNSNARGWGTFEDELIGVRNSKKNLKTVDGKLKYPVLEGRAKVDFPLCVVGNGPSLDDLLPFIKQNQEKMIILSCGTALKPLRNYGIKPDFQVELERLPFLKGILEDSGLDGTPLLAANIVDSSTLEAASESYIFMRASSAPTYMYRPRFILEDSFPFVGNAGLSLALNFSKEIYLCGLDMGYKKGRSKHAKNSFYGEEDSALPPDALHVKGNFSDDIYSTSIFALSREFAEFAIVKNRDSKVYNLSDGAHIKGAEAKKSKSLKLKKRDKQKAINSIKASFSKDKESIKAIGEEFEDRSFIAYKDMLGHLLSKKVDSKRELFERVDEIYERLEDFKSSNPAFGILLNGSMQHILDTLFTVLLHVKRDDIGALYSEFARTIIDGFPIFESKYKISALLGELE